MTKAERQPHAAAMNGIVAGATMGPTFDPALKRAVANARSFLGNHCAAALIADGKLPYSLRPTPRRPILKPVKVEMSP